MPNRDQLIEFLQCLASGAGISAALVLPCFMATAMTAHRKVFFGLVAFPRMVTMVDSLASVVVPAPVVW